MNAPNPSDAADIEEIKQLKARYFRTLDRQDWDALRDLFTVDAFIDTTDDTGRGSEITGRDRFVKMLTRALAGALTVHHGHNPDIKLTGTDTAAGVWAMEDHIWFAPASGMEKLWGTGWYEEKYQRVDGRWRIARMVLRRHRVELDGVQLLPRPAKS